MGASHHKSLNIVSDLVDYPLEKNLLNFNLETKPETKIVTVISQGALTDSIADYIINNIQYLNGYDINYKLHPSEYNVVNEKLLKLDKYANVRLVRNANLFDMFYSSKCVIGVFSTALIEAKLMGCEVAIIPLAGSEYFENSIGYSNITDLFNELV